MTTVFRKVNASVLALLGLAALASAAAPKPVVESATLFAKDKQRLVELSAELNGSKQLFLVVAEIDGNACDWANWIDPEVTLVDGTVVDLTKLKWKEVESLGTTRVGKNYDGKPLKIAGKEYTRGIGTHASSFIAFDLPGPAKSFRSKVGIDDGGAIRGG